MFRKSATGTFARFALAHWSSHKCLSRPFARVRKVFRKAKNDPAPPGNPADTITVRGPTGPPTPPKRNLVCSPRDERAEDSATYAPHKHAIGLRESSPAATRAARRGSRLRRRLRSGKPPGSRRARRQCPASGQPDPACCPDAPRRSSPRRSGSRSWSAGGGT